MSFKMRRNKAEKDLLILIDLCTLVSTLLVQWSVKLVSYLSTFVMRKVFFFPLFGDKVAIVLCHSSIQEMQTIWLQVIHAWQ